MRAAGVWNPTDPNFDTELLRRFYEKLKGMAYYQQHPAQFDKLQTVIGASSQTAADCT
jgi:hypothetical protein